MHNKRQATRSNEFGWPRLLTTTRAAEYADVAPATIRTAVRAGALKPHGRRGGRGEMVFTIESVEAWMTGGEAAPVELDPTAHATGDPAASMARIRAAAAKGGDR